MSKLSITPATFVAGADGVWRIHTMRTESGDGLPPATHLATYPGEFESRGGEWALRGVAGHARYVERAEKGPLDQQSPPLGRPEANRAALIPIRKSDEWWALPQDERRAIFETRSHHIANSMRFLPRIARRLYHCRDLGEPFDFLTWFEFSADHSAAFDELLGLLRESEEWAFVEREVEVRLER